MIGWMTDLDEAKTYFIEKRLEVKAWDAMVDVTKEKALWNAYNRINNSPEFSIPAAPTATQLLKLKDAQCEMAYYLAIHLADEDSRKGLQAQGVAHAGLAKEIYDRSKLAELPIPPAVADILADMSTSTATSMVPIDRDEDEDLDTDVVEES